MDNEHELLDSSNQQEVNLDEIDIDALKEQYKKLSENHKDVSSKNRQLYERAKKAEGFDKDEEGNWTKTIKPKKEKADEELIQRLDKLALKSANIVEAKKVELFEKWRTETGRDADAIIENPIFQKELEALDIETKNQAATSNIQGEGGGSSAQSTPEYWIGKATKDSSGKLFFPEEMPKEMFTKVLDKLTGTGEKKSNLQFYNSK